MTDSNTSLQINQSPERLQTLKWSNARQLGKTSNVQGLYNCIYKISFSGMNRISSIRIGYIAGNELVHSMKRLLPILVDPRLSVNSAGRFIVRKIKISPYSYMYMYREVSLFTMKINQKLDKDASISELCLQHFSYAKSNIYNTVSLIFFFLITLIQSLVQKRKHNAHVLPSM